MQAFIQTAVSQPFQAAFGGRHAAAYPFQNATGDHTGAAHIPHIAVGDRIEGRCVVLGVTYRGVVEQVIFSEYFPRYRIKAIRRVGTQLQGRLPKEAVVFPTAKLLDSSVVALAEEAFRNRAGMWKAMTVQAAHNGYRIGPSGVGVADAHEWIGMLPATVLAAAVANAESASFKLDAAGPVLTFEPTGKGMLSANWGGYACRMSLESGAGGSRPGWTWSIWAGPLRTFIAGGSTPSPEESAHQVCQRLRAFGAYSALAA